MRISYNEVLRYAEANPREVFFTGWGGYACHCPAARVLVSRFPDAKEVSFDGHCGHVYKRGEADTTIYSTNKLRRVLRRLDKYTGFANPLIRSDALIKHMTGEEVAAFMKDNT